MYTIGQAAVRSGVGVSLLRAWERRYGIVAPTRTASGYRLYDDDAIARLRAMRRLVDAGWSASHAAEAILTTPDLAATPTAGADAGPRTTVRAGVGEPDDDALVAAAATYDPSRVEAVLDDLFARG